jgi:hypothetical protein
MDVVILRGLLRADVAADKLSETGANARGDVNCGTIGDRRVCHPGTPVYFASIAQDRRARRDQSSETRAQHAGRVTIATPRRSNDAQQ